MNDQVIVCSQCKNDLIWHEFCNCSIDLKVINFISLSEVFDHSACFEFDWLAFSCIYSLFSKNLMIFEHIWSFNQNSDIIFHKRVNLIFHDCLSLYCIQRLNDFLIDFRITRICNFDMSDICFDFSKSCWQHKMMIKRWEDSLIRDICSKEIKKLIRFFFRIWQLKWWWEWELRMWLSERERERLITIFIINFIIRFFADLLINLIINLMNFVDFILK